MSLKMVVIEESWECFDGIAAVIMEGCKVGHLSWRG